MGVVESCQWIDIGDGKSGGDYLSKCICGMISVRFGTSDRGLWGIHYCLKCGKPVEIVTPEVRETG